MNFCWGIVIQEQSNANCSMYCISGVQMKEQSRDRVQLRGAAAKRSRMRQAAPHSSQTRQTAASASSQNIGSSGRGYQSIHPVLFGAATSSESSICGSLQDLPTQLNVVVETHH